MKISHSILTSMKEQRDKLVEQSNEIGKQAAAINSAIADYETAFGAPPVTEGIHPQEPQKKKRGRPKRPETMQEKLRKVAKDRWARAKALGLKGGRLPKEAELERLSKRRKVA